MVLRIRDRQGNLGKGEIAYRSTAGRKGENRGSDPGAGPTGSSAMNTRAVAAQPLTPRLPLRHHPPP